MGNVFENAIPKLLGADTHAAIGSVTEGVSSTSNTSGANSMGSFNGLDTTFTSSNVSVIDETFSVPSGNNHAAVSATVGVSGTIGGGGRTVTLRLLIDSVLVNTSVFDYLSSFTSQIRPFGIGVMKELSVGSHDIEVTASCTFNTCAVMSTSVGVIPTLIECELTGDNTQHTTPAKRVFS